ncbi:MAG TPA: SurA N-terminal domain-containing protein, partial [Methylomirabilota bacterium]
MRGRRAAAPRLSVLLLLLFSGCSSMPSWMPLIGKSEPPAEAPKPPASTSAPLLSTRDPIASGTDSSDLLDRVICVVNNDAITMYELDEAELYFLAETREKMQEGDARKALRERLLQNLIENRIQLQQAEREKVVVEDSEVAENIADVMKKLKVTDEKQFDQV